MVINRVKTCWPAKRDGRSGTLRRRPRRRRQNRRRTPASLEDYFDGSTPRLASRRHRADRPARQMLATPHAAR